MGESYDWKAKSGLAVTLEMYVKTMLVVILVLKIYEIFVKCCCKNKYDENDDDDDYYDAADVDIEPVKSLNKT